VGTSSTNQGDLVLNSSVTNIGENAFNGTAYERIYLLASTSSGVSVGTFAFNFLSGQATLFVPESWDAGSYPITLNDRQYTYSTDDGTLVVMYAPTVNLTVGGAHRVSGTSDQATVNFQVDTTSTITIKDSAGNILWEGQANAGTPVSAAFTVEGSAAISGLTIVATPSVTYPAGALAQVYNTVSGTGTETFSVPAMERASTSDASVPSTTTSTLAQTADTLFLWMFLALGGIVVAGISLLVLRKKVQ
jgi:hypothetical protein